MDLLLTSSGISNPSINEALVDLLGKPIAESSALFVPTAIYPFPGGGGRAMEALSGAAKSPLCELGWKSLGVLELTALPSIQRESWVPLPSKRLTRFSFGAAMFCTCATGCDSPASQTCCRRWRTWSTWG